MFEKARRAGYTVGVEFGAVFAPTITMSAVPDEALSRPGPRAWRRFCFGPRRAWRIFRAAPANRPPVRNFFEVVRVSLFKKPLY